ncbi:MAG: hypothetical protein K2X82_07245 [Gemmataceae bacterium]|nr:hypothetical protein [Gemmataceae bacterium]
MSLTKKLSIFAITIVSAISAGAGNRVTAAPPPGERWSDMAFRGSSSAPPSRVGPSYAAPRYYSAPRPAPGYPQPAAPAVASAAPATPATVAIRGPDGVVRTFPVEGPTVQQGQPAFVSVRGTDGVVRAYPAAGGPTGPGQAVASPAPTAATPVVTRPCR